MRRRNKNRRRFRENKEGLGGFTDEEVEGILDKLEQFGFEYEERGTGVLFQSPLADSPIYVEGELVFMTNYLQVDLMYEDVRLNRYSDDVGENPNMMPKVDLHNKLDAALTLFKRDLRLGLEDIQDHLRV